MKRSEFVYVLIASVVFALAAGSGVYGYGADFYANYIQPNLRWGGYSDRLGFVLATLTIGGVHVGVYITSFLLAVSTGVFLFAFANEYRYGNRSLVYMSHIIFLHTWPIIMSTSNGMRQGIMMSFLFLCFYSLLKKKTLLFCTFFVLVFLSHKSSSYFLTLLLIVLAVKFLSDRRFLYLSQRALGILSGVVAFSGLLIVAPYLGLFGDESRIISGDFRGPFLVINFTYVAYYLVSRKSSNDVLSTYLLVFSMTAPVLLTFGQNWQYERVNMVMLIPYMIVLTRVLQVKLRSFSLWLGSTALLFMTVFTGMYASLN